MKTYEEQKALIKDLIRSNMDLNKIECREIIAEDDDRLLVRVVGAMKMAGKWWPTLNHELWFDKEKYKAGISSEFIDCKQHIYMANIAGSSEEKLLAYFNKIPILSH